MTASWYNLFKNSTVFVGLVMIENRLLLIVYVF